MVKGKIDVRALNEEEHMAFLNSFLSYLVLYLVFFCVIICAVFAGKFLRKRKDAKDEQANREVITKTEEL